jgi:hypothetical protein
VNERDEQQRLFRLLEAVVADLGRPVSITLVVLPAAPGMAHGHVISTHQDVEACLEAALKHVRMADQPAQGPVQ